MPSPNEDTLMPRGRKKSVPALPETVPDRPPVAPVAVLAADLHLDPLRPDGRPIGAWKNQSILGDSRCGLLEVADVCVHFRDTVKDLFLLGDVFDTVEVDPSTLKFFFRTVDTLRSYGIRVHAIQGDHDFCVGTSWVSLGGQDLAADGRIVTLQNGLQVLCKDYVRPWDMNWAAVPELKDADVLACHQRWSEGLAFPDANHGSITQVPFVSQVWSGDNHTTSIKEVVRPDGTLVKFVSPGATHLRDISQPPDKYVILVMSDGTVRKHPIRSRPVVKVILDDPEHLSMLKAGVLSDERLAAMSEGLRPLIKTPIVVVTCREKSSRISTAVREAFGSRVHLFFNVTASTEETGSNEDIEEIEDTGECEDTEPAPDVTAEIQALLKERKPGTDALAVKLIVSAVNQGSISADFSALEDRFMRPGA